ncbi:MAG: septum formation initiator family protein [Candidatus Nealsonbacteria bacterium]|nr:septum formation initiator family protein [Candidatus Nealsonbacteria bacterium]
MIRGLKRKKEKKSLEMRAISFLFSFAVIFLIFLLLVSNIRIHQRRSELKAQIEIKEQEMNELRLRADYLEGINLTEEDYLIEKMAREQLLLKKEGEEVVVFSFPEEVEEKEKEVISEFIWWNPLTWKIR